MTKTKLHNQHFNPQGAAKRSFPSEEIAQKTATVQSIKLKRHFHTYQCEVCNAFHIGKKVGR